MYGYGAAEGYTGYDGSGYGSYQSNYPQQAGYGGGGYGGGGYGGGYQQAGYGGGGGYGGYGAYNMNAGYPMGAAAPPGGGYGGYGCYQNYQVPAAVQQCASYYQNMVTEAPPGVQLPVSQQVSNYQAQNLQYQAMMQQQMKDDMIGRKKKKKRKGRRRRRRDDDDEDEDDEDEDEEDEEEEEEPAAPKGMTEEEFKERLKGRFVDELLRRQTVSGTFEMTEGTVRGIKCYPEDDPVVKYVKDEEGSDFAGEEWDPESDCRYLRWAMKGLGTNDDAIVHVVTTRNNDQRQQLKTMFKTAYGRDLIDDIKSELSGDYKEAVMACFVKPAYYDAWCIKEAIYGLGTDEDALIEILMTRPNDQIQEAVEAYTDITTKNTKRTGTKLDKDIEDDCSGDFKRLLTSAAQGNRYMITRNKLEKAVEEVIVEDNPTGLYEVNYSKLCDVNKCKRDAEQLFKAGEDCWGTDEDTFNRIFATRDYYTLKTIWDEYVKLTQRDILNSIDRETSGDYKRGLRAIVMNIRYRPMFFAERLMKAMKGLGTDERTLIRIIVSRSEIDMVQIKKCFLDLTKKTLWKWLEHDCSFNFKKLLQGIVGKN